jgi:uncharacterized protein YuzE
MKFGDVDIDIAENGDIITLTISGSKQKLIETLISLVKWFQIFF